MLDDLRNLRVLQWSSLPRTTKAQISTRIDRVFSENDPALYAEILNLIAPFPESKSLSSFKDQEKYGTSYTDVINGYHLVRSYLAVIADEKRRQRKILNRRRDSTAMTFEKNGYIIINDWFAKASLDELRPDLEKFPLGVSKNESNLVMSNLTPALNKFISDPELYATITQCLGYDDEESERLFHQNTFVQKLHNKKGDGDVQKVFHQDTFFPAIKFWFFPDEVTLDSGPLEYSPGSHVFDMDRAHHTYSESLRIIKKIHPYTKDHGEGSLRIDPERLKQKPKPMTVPANSLVIANVFGFHRRGEVLREGFRTSIHGSIRTNQPFKV